MAGVGGSRPCKQNRALGIRWRRDAHLDIQIRRRRFGSTKGCSVTEGGGVAVGVGVVGAALFADAISSHE